MTVKEKLENGIRALKAAHVETPGLDAEILVSMGLGKPREFLYAHWERPLSKSETTRIDKAFERRLKREPIAYITGSKRFFGMDISVNRHTLIPRPETEGLVEAAIKLAKAGKRNKAGKNARPVTIADIGTGSGAVAIALAKGMPSAAIIATDASERALKKAKENARSNNVRRIKFLKGDLALPLKARKVNMIVANLPYLSKKVYDRALKLYPEISYEPRTALLSGTDGLDHITTLIKQVADIKASSALRKSLRHIVLEIGCEQGPAIKKLAKEHLTKSRTTIKTDLCGKDRIAIIRLALTRAE